MTFKVIEKGRAVLTAPATGVRISRKAPPSTKGKFITAVNIAPDVARAMGVRAGDAVVFSIGTGADAGRVAITRTGADDLNGYGLRKNGQWLTTTTQRLDIGAGFSSVAATHEMNGPSLVIDIPVTSQAVAAE
jgi:hypothetical protein